MRRPKRASRRDRLLREAGLRFAAPMVRRAFWAVRNRQPPPGPQALADVVAGMLAAGELRRWQPTAPLAAILHEILPQELAADVALGPPRRGVLTLFVSSAARAYCLEREFGGRILAALRARVPRAGIEELRVRVGAGVESSPQGVAAARMGARPDGRPHEPA